MKLTPDNLKVQLPELNDIQRVAVQEYARQRAHNTLVEMFGGSEWAADMAEAIMVQVDEAVAKREQE